MSNVIESAQAKESGGGRLSVGDRTRSSDGLMTAASLLLVLGLACTACDSGDSHAAAPSPPPTATPAPAVAPTPSTPPAPTAPAELPRAEDVLPPGEVSAGALVVEAEGYRFQIRPALTEVTDEPDFAIPGARAFRGRIDGMLRPTDVFVRVSREPYAGDLAAAVEETRTNNVTARVTMDAPVSIARAGQWTQPAHRFVFSGASSVRMHVIAVDGGYRYWFRCELPPEPGAWTNAGVDCMTMGSTLHIAPPRR